MHEFAPTETFPRAAGVLLHPTSLPSAHGIGDLGEGAHLFLKFLANAGVSYWQMLPTVPVGPGDSPYSSPSSMAGNPLLIDLKMLAAAGLLDRDDIAAPPFSPDRVDYAAVRAFKLPRLDKAAARLVENPGHGFYVGLKRFRADNPWVEDFALFMALRRHHANAPWWDWEPALRDRHPEALEQARREHMAEVERAAAIQFFFDLQWQSLRVQCKDLGIRLIGDVPIYVDGDSVDVWANRGQFVLADNGRPLDVSGAPPDTFSEIGQMWGNPLYDWKRMASDGYAFWKARMKRALALTDLVRIDHFRGFSAYWAIPATAPDARHGRWRRGPGKALFDALTAELGPLPIIAEDLGVIDVECEQLREDVGLPGLKLLVFAFGEDALNAYLPHHHQPNSVVYTGTHDTNTVLGWWRETSEHVRDHVRRYFGRDGNDVVWDLIRAALMSASHTAIIPMQDLLALDEGGRMNIPGQGEGNWAWRIRAEGFHPHLADRLGEMVRLYDRDELKRIQLQGRHRRLVIHPED